MAASAILYPPRTPPKAPRQQLQGLLQGSKVLIPDLKGIFSHWPYAVNPHLEQLQANVDEKLESLFEGKRCKKMKAANPALYGASCWPYAPLEKLTIATDLGIWLLAWDDETDSAEYSSIGRNLQATSDFCAETSASIQKMLFEPSEMHSEISSNKIIRSFQPIADGITKIYSQGQVETLFHELEYHTKMTGLEQRTAMSGKLPTVEKYMQWRMGSSSVGVCLALTELGFETELPSSVMNDQKMRQLWREITIIMGVTNDLLSFKKEVAAGQVDTLVPLLCLRHGSLKMAVTEAINMIKTSVRNFDDTASQFLAQFSEDPTTRVGLERFIGGCRHASTANLYWSLGSARYGLGTPTDAGILIEL